MEDDCIIWDEDFPPSVGEEHIQRKLHQSIFLFASHHFIVIFCRYSQ